MLTKYITETILASSLQETDDWVQQFRMEEVRAKIIPLSELINITDNSLVTAKYFQQDTTILSDSITRESDKNILGKIY